VRAELLLADGRTDRRTDGETDRRTDGQRDGRKTDTGKHVGRQTHDEAKSFS